MSDIVLNPEDIEAHYNALYSSSNVEVTNNIVEDMNTNLSIKNTINAANTYGMELENLVKTCIQVDAQNLSKLGASFIQKDADVSTQIDAMLS